VTLFGLVFTPAFYVLCRKWAGKRRNAPAGESLEQTSAPTI
ncbi:hypothetical protein GGD83_004728, partial [Rhodoblastus sphagnicola]|nr:hypothetical protein [Rhodoblastus sphagnicola]